MKVGYGTEDCILTFRYRARCSVYKFTASAFDKMEHKQDKGGIFLCFCFVFVIRTVAFDYLKEVLANLEWKGEPVKVPGSHDTQGMLMC